MKRLFQSFVRYVRSFFVKIDLNDLVKNHEAQVVDVRTEVECANFGCIKDSVNIPLDDLRLKMGQLDKDKPVIICCGNGIRSGLAKQILQQNGFKKVFKGGTYESLKRKLRSSG